MLSRPLRHGRALRTASEGDGWLGLAGYLLFSLFYASPLPLSFLRPLSCRCWQPRRRSLSKSFLSIINGATSEVSLGALPLLYAAGTVGYVLGGLLFGVTMFRAHVLPRWATALFAAGAVLPLVLRSRTRSIAHLPCPWGSRWSGWAMRSGLTSTPVAQPLPGEAMAQLRPSVAK